MRWARRDAVAVAAARRTEDGGEALVEVVLAVVDGQADRDQARLRRLQPPPLGGRGGHLWGWGGRFWV